MYTFYYLSEIHNNILLNINKKIWIIVIGEINTSNNKVLKVKNIAKEGHFYWVHVVFLG
mgnify:CR=1 FL=1